MQFNGTASAVLDRPAMSLSAALSAGEAPSVPVTPLAVEAVRLLPYGELAVALYASDMPTRRAHRAGVSVEQMAAWACQGLERLGQGQVWWVAHRSARLGGRLVGDLITPAEQAELKRLMPSPRRDQSAHDAAWWLGARVGRPAARWVWVDTADDETNQYFQVRVNARDVEFTATYAPLLEGFRACASADPKSALPGVA